MAHLRNWKTQWTSSTEIKPEHKYMKLSANGVKFQKALRKLDQKLATRKIEMDKVTGYPIPSDLIKEGMEAAQKVAAQKASYESAKKAEKLWTKAQKEASKEAKKVARREKRLAARA